MNVTIRLYVVENILNFVLFPLLDLLKITVKMHLRLIIIIKCVLAAFIRGPYTRARRTYLVLFYPLVCVTDVYGENLGHLKLLFNMHYWKLMIDGGYIVFRFHRNRAIRRLHDLQQFDYFSD